MNEILQGDVLEALKTLPDESVNCVVTSPPYFGLRDYSACGCREEYDGGKHSGNNILEGHLSPRPKEPDPNCPKCHGTGKDEAVSSGQIGLEPTPEAYVQKLVEVFREVRRVLRKDGTLWLNLGDSYNGTGDKAKYGFTDAQSKQATNKGSVAQKGMNLKGLKPKDLIGIPWRVAFALQADGWWLRQDIIWAKPNPMPESVTDRCTKAHEYIFLLTKSARYYYDAEAIREKSEVVWNSAKSSFHFDPETSNQKKAAMVRDQGLGTQGGSTHEDIDKDYRNKRSVWTITTKPYPEAHFATFPPELPELCIKAGCPKDGTVLDPFAGSGTTLQVAADLGRKYLGIELNPDYIKLAQKRIGNRLL